jgi:long-chain acyl-CoA synthetase
MVTAIGLWAIAGADPTRTAVVEPDDRPVSYGELVGEADRIGRGLQAAGLRPGDCLVVMLPNGATMLAAYFAAMQTGLYFVPVNWHLVAAEVAYILADSGAAAFIADERFAGVAVAAADEAAIPAARRFGVGSLPGFTPLHRLGAGGSGRPTTRTAGAPMVYTSGTSGRPKGVRRPLTGADPDQVPPTAVWFFGLFGLAPFDDHAHLCGSPLYHTAVLNFATISVQFGHRTVLMDRWEPEHMLRLIERYAITHSHMVPTQFRRLLALPDDVRARYDLSSMRSMIHSAAPCPIETKRRMIEWWGPVVVEYYAASEGGGTLIGAEEWLRRPGSVGRAWPGSEVRVLSEPRDNEPRDNEPRDNEARENEGREDVPPGTVGSVFLRMGDSTFAYHHDEAKTRSAFAGRLFTVGDVGYLDADGYLFLCDRGSDLIISGGVNIYPAEIEGELAGHPRVADVAVFGIPHTDWGEEIKAVVQLEPGAVPGPELTAELLSFLDSRLARFKLPRTIDYVEELPRDPNGKLYKRRLRDPYWAGHERGPARR